MAKNIDFMGATFPDVPSIRLPQHEGGLVSFTDVTDTTTVASDVANGKYFYTADGEKTVGTASGGITPSGTISISQNGQVDVTNYATADVNVSGGGGASNFVTGTFTTGSTASQIETVTIPYTGNGYPIALVIYVEGGCYNPNISPWYSSNAKYAVGQVIITKCVTTTAPTYDASGSVEDNTGTIMLFYKSSTEGVYSRAGAINAVSYNAGNPTGTSTLCVKWHSDKSIYYITSGGTSTKYGLHLNTTYRYYAVYSS